MPAYEPTTLLKATAYYTFLAITALCITSNTSVANPATTTMTKVCGSNTAPGDVYVNKLIELAFSYSSATVRISEMENNNCSHARQKDMVASGKSDYIWAATTSEYEGSMIPIRIPIYKGLLGYRISLIRREDSDAFSHIESFDQLKQFTFGQGEGWADTAILKNAGLNVVQSTDTWNLYNMLRAGRFHMFPRGIMEPWDEAANLTDLDLAVESHLLLVYPMPAYIFITPKRPELAALIEDGLIKAINDGSFDALFLSDPQVKQALELSNIHTRKVFKLTNPDLPPKTPLNNKKLWIDIE